MEHLRHLREDILLENSSLKMISLLKLPIEGRESNLVLGKSRTDVNGRLTHETGVVQGTGDESEGPLAWILVELAEMITLCSSLMGKWNSLDIELAKPLKGFTIEDQLHLCWSQARMKKEEGEQDISEQSIEEERSSENIENSSMNNKTGSTTQWQANLALKEMAVSDMRKRRHVQRLLTWEYKRCSSCIPGLGALTGYYQLGQLSPGINAEEKFKVSFEAESKINSLLIKINRSLRNLNKNTFSGETHLELPKFQLPTFSGDISDWLSFKEIFIRSIDQNPTLGNFQKLQYLNSALKGNAARLIRAELAFKQIQNLYDLKNVKQESTKDLLDLLDTCNESIQNLSILGLERNNLSDMILIHIIQSKLDCSIRKEWEMRLLAKEYPLKR
ncbi:hypothetical protein LAZ67_3001279 [Cordylochernes scorpioides]|uniref:Uncharacterized protein n=1 Tax=Cordylochernes scorpioides TaxID=51811 RepID=A0ABY6K6Z2_9ARAC|nr:hypothetical protein LAZ67_3001279 [Cordylochernes scorpioides]